MSDEQARPTAETFRVRIADEVLDDLRARIRQTRWPQPSPAEPWEQGADLDYLRDLLEHWADGFDWRAREAQLNSLHHVTLPIDGVRVHAVWERAKSGSGIPLVLTHGWPSTFAEMLPLVPLLTDPQAHGIDGPAFDVVIPSLPGYGFSERPHRTGVTIREVARMWHALMRGLGYDRYGAHGTDFGSGVATMMALHDPEPLVGVHLSNLDVDPYLGSGTAPLFYSELTYRERAEAFWVRERGYKEIQSTRPQTLAYGLNDSPAGLAAWVVDKWRSWSDNTGEIAIARDDLLTTLTLFWATQTMPTSIRDYYDNRWFPPGPGAGERVTVPTGVAVFAHQLADEGEPPRAWAQRLYNVTRWTVMPRGGHFAATEEPDLLARDIVAFFGDLKT